MFDLANYIRDNVESVLDHGAPLHRWLIEIDGVESAWWKGEPAVTFQSLGRDFTPQGDSDFDCINIDMRSANDADASLPVYKVTVRYAINWTPQGEADLAGDVDQARRAFLREQYRTVTAEDASVKVKNLPAEELTVETYLVSEEDAQEEAERIGEDHAASPSGE